MVIEESPRRSRDAGVGVESPVERVLNQYISSSIHLFLSLLAIIIFAAAIVSAYVLVMSDFPELWQRGAEYSALQSFIHDILLVAIAGELGLLLLFHRTSAAIEVVVFVIARKMVSPDVTGADLLFGGVALAILVFARFYFLPGKTK